MYYERKIPGARLEPLTLDRKMDAVQEYEHKVTATRYYSQFSLNKV